MITFSIFWHLRATAERCTRSCCILRTLSVPSHPLSLARTLFEWERGTNLACRAATAAASYVDPPSVSQLKHLRVRVAIRRCALTDVILAVTQSCQFSKELADGRRYRPQRVRIRGSSAWKACTFMKKSCLQKDEIWNQQQQQQLLRC